MLLSVLLFLGRIVRGRHLGDTLDGHAVGISRELAIGINAIKGNGATSSSCNRIIRVHIEILCYRCREGRQPPG
jgi:hypothetical protein